MRVSITISLAVAAALLFLGLAPFLRSAPEAASYTLPKNYREWVFLSSGLDMVYGPQAALSPGQSKFDNVFVNPEAYRTFLKTGSWPDKTTLVLEIRAAETNQSINRGGHSQGPAIRGIEVHRKDRSSSPDGWLFFDVDPSGVGKPFPHSADCYTCHRDHAAVDTTFVQFYPTLLSVARERQTLSPAYRRELTSTHH